MTLRSNLVKGLRRVVTNPSLKRALIAADVRLELARHTVAGVFPILIQPQTVKMTVAITANCNLRCVGCRYGRDFMNGSQLPFEMVRDLLDDGSRLGVETVRLYGGEPLLHRDLPQMIRHALKVGIKPYVTTNGVLLESRIDGLYEAGLRTLTIGFYGVGDAYNQYVQRPGRFADVEGGIAAVRKRYGNKVSLQLNFLLMRPTCTVDAVQSAWEFCKRYDMAFRVDLIHYSLPYFSEGPDRCLQFTPDDAAAIENVVAEFVRLKQTDPVRFTEPLMVIRSMPDWLLKGPEMRVPCDVYRMIWVGADGTVQLCYVTFKLGNLHQQRLADMLYTKTHRDAAQAAFALRCPNCHCERDTRIQTHMASRRAYGGG